MAAVFLMQSIGQLAAYSLGLLILFLTARARGLDHGEQNFTVASPVIDEFWRILLGIGAIPALIAIGLRRIIPETPLWLAVHRHVGDADARRRRGLSVPFRRGDRRREPTGTDGIARTKTSRGAVESAVDYLVGVRKYLARERPVARSPPECASCGSWSISPSTALVSTTPGPSATSWLSQPVNADVGDGAGTNSTQCDFKWRADPAQPDISIYDMLQQDAVRNMITISTGTVTGSVVILLAINYIPRASWMACWFVALGALFLINGSTFFVAFESNKYALTITLYVLAQAMFNLGPNTISFILPAELFDTRYRGPSTALRRRPGSWAPSSSSSSSTWRCTAETAASSPACCSACARPCCLVLW